MLKVKAGDTGKLSLLYERHKGKLFGFFYRLTSDGPLSEDLVQNVFYRLLKYRHTYAGKGQFLTWLYHMARNVNIDNYRKTKRMNYQEDMQEWEGHLKDEKGPDHEMSKNQEVELLNIALNKMTHDKREILVLSKFQELKYEEIGNILDLSVAAVKVRVHRAMNELKTVYHSLETAKS